MFLSFSLFSFTITQTPIIESQLLRTLEISNFEVYIQRQGTSFENIQEIEDKLNNKPRKSLNWRTPNEVSYERKKTA